MLWQAEGQNRVGKRPIAEWDKTWMRVSDLSRQSSATQTPQAQWSSDGYYLLFSIPNTRDNSSKLTQPTQ